MNLMMTNTTTRTTVANDDGSVYTVVRNGSNMAVVSTWVQNDIGHSVRFVVRSNGRKKVCKTLPGALRAAVRIVEAR